MVTEKQEVFNKAKALGLVEGDYKSPDYQNNTTAQLRDMVAKVKEETEEKPEEPVKKTVKKANEDLWECSICHKMINVDELKQHAKGHRKRTIFPRLNVTFVKKRSGLVVSHKRL